MLFIKLEISLIITLPSPLEEPPEQSKFSTVLIITVRIVLVILPMFSASALPEFAI
jgi:hypothetical protein